MVENKIIRIVIGVVVILSLLSVIAFFKNKADTLKRENTILINNLKAYENELIGMQDSLQTVRGTYKMTLAELSISKDKIAMELNKVRIASKIKDKELQELRHFKATIKTDTTINIVINDSCEFKTRIEYNPQTIFNVETKRINGRDSLYHSAEISASFNAINYTKSQWKESNILKRIFLFRWGKYHYEQNTLTSDNDQIVIKDFRIIKIIE